MLYLPEFALYTDPTASSSAFGVLPAGSYDKPVLRISDAGSVAARTPPMKAEDHMTTSKTTITIDVDGRIIGETQQVSTGVYASGARGTAMRIQTQGRQNYAVTMLRYLGHPGTGQFEPALPSDLSEPYTLQGSFALNAKLPTAQRSTRDAIRHAGPQVTGRLALGPASGQSKDRLLLLRNHPGGGDRFHVCGRASSTRQAPGCQDRQQVFRLFFQL